MDIKSVLLAIFAVLTLSSSGFCLPVEIGDTLGFVKIGNTVSIYEVKGHGFSDNYNFEDFVIGNISGNNGFYELVNLYTVDVSALSVDRLDLSVEYTKYSGIITADDYVYDFSWIGHWNIVENFYAVAEIFEKTAINTAPVPEPTTILLFGVGLIGLAGFSRKKS